jgi:hypothetical protein
MLRTFSLAFALLLIAATAMGCASSRTAPDESVALTGDEVLSVEPRLAPLLAFLETENLAAVELRQIPIVQTNTDAEAQYQIAVRSSGGERRLLGVRVYPSEEVLQEELRRRPQFQTRQRQRQRGIDFERQPVTARTQQFVGVFHSGPLLVVQREEDHLLTAALRRSFGRQVR